MESTARVRLEIRSPLARLTLNRPEVRNAFDDALIGELKEALAQVRATYEGSPEKAPRALVLTGEGQAFCAGADMNWMRRSIAYTREENEADARAFLAAQADFATDPPDNFPLALDADGWLRCLPHHHGTDGFAAVRFRRS